MRVAIHGFGRIGRQVFKALWQRRHEGVEVVAIADLTPPETDMHLLKHDSVYGPFREELRLKGTKLSLGPWDIEVLKREKNDELRTLPWADLGVDLVIEATGQFTKAGLARGHLDAGARRVLITAPAEGPDVTLVMGVNHEWYDPYKHYIVSGASCTTNCLAPVAKVLHEKFGIEKGFMTTAHAYTSDQRLVDAPHGDLRRARAAAQNIIPTRTGAAQAIHEVIPELEGRMHGVALRVPTPTVSVVDLVAVLTEKTTREEVLKAFCEYQRRWESQGLKILRVEEEPLVSSDFIGEEYSAVVDAQYVLVLQESLVKVLAWYDNEWGYSLRIADLVAHMARTEARGKS